jgi:uncharacterized protein with NRDE domain
MCVLAFAWRAHPRWRLVLAGNRDELHARPAAALARWTEPDHLLAGRDLEAGGTWLGVSEHGRLAVITNLRGHGPPAPGRPSRGALATDLLARNGGHADATTADLAACNPLNLIYAEAGEAWFLTNRPHTARTRLARGLYGLSNGTLDEPWPKTLQLKAALLDWIVHADDDPAPLLDTLASRTLPDFGRAPDLPSEVPLEPGLSPLFIRHPVYGTRCSTIVTVDAHGAGRIIERRFAADGAVTGQTMLDFRWPDG